MDEYSRDKANFFGIQSLLYSWIRSVGTLAVILFVSMYVSKIWLPAVVLLMEFLLIRRLNILRNSDTPMCNMLPFMMTRVLIIAAIIMVTINLYYMKFIDPQEYVVGTANRKIPYITILVISPVTLVVTLWAYLRRHKIGFCRECRIRYGMPSERGFIGKVFSSESRYQLRMLIFISAGITAYTWIYYYMKYSNVNLNHADLFYYVWIPIILYILSIIYLGRRYFNIYLFFRQNIVGDATMKVSSTLLRYIIVSGDSVFLDDVAGQGSKKDTPASVNIPYRERVTLNDAKIRFENISGLHDEADIRFLYVNANKESACNIFHYLCVMKSRNSIDASGLKGKWYQQSQLERMLGEGLVSSLLASEIHRIYTVTMASKTYDRNGHRLYEIKHYKPSFRIRDLDDIDVDFNDPVWLMIADDNEDRPFFHLRKLWRKYVSGENIN